jgi:hypothetical protein
MKYSHIKNILIHPCFLGLVLALIFLTSCDGKKHESDNRAPDHNLKVVIIRHGEKPKDGDNLSCQGQNRALQLPAVLHQKFNVPDYIYVPALKGDESTKHSRMFQTISPFAIKYNVTINSKYNSNENEKIARSVLKKSGVVLMVWDHSAIQSLASTLGIHSAPQWDDADFDSIWVISFDNGAAKLTTDSEGLTPSQTCHY